MSNPGPAPKPDPQAVRSMFARISGRYDCLNHLLSAGIDRSWRRAAVEQAGGAGGAGVRGQAVLDVCSGTGDLALAFARAGARVVGVDFAPEMLAHALEKRPGGGRSLFAAGDALALPVASGAFDVAAVAFGLRNLADARAGLSDLARAVRPGGLVLVLEFSPPRPGLSGSLYRAYSARVLPWVGGLISGDREAYRYLPRTVAAWPGPEELARTFASAALEDCGWRALSMGVACLHWGRVARRAP
jgi:demethylmenaquinone methyltransferase/2-methoxy-6-polyprenyl-1,4-benzoquinol methylase